MVLNVWTVLAIRKHRVDVQIPAREKISAASGKQHLSPESFVIGNNRKKNVILIKLIILTSDPNMPEIW